MYKKLIDQVSKLSHKYDKSLVDDIISEIDNIFYSYDESQKYQRRLILKVRNAIKQHSHTKFTKNQIIILSHSICQAEDSAISHSDVLSAEIFMICYGLSPNVVIDF